MKRWWFPKNEEKMMARKIQNKCLLDVLKFYSNNENNEFKYQNNNSSKEPGIVANPSKL